MSHRIPCQMWFALLAIEVILHGSLTQHLFHRIMFPSQYTSIATEIQQVDLELHTGPNLAKVSTVGSRSIQPSWRFPLIPIVNKLCNIECCVNNMLIQNMVSQCSELELSMFRGTTLSGQHPLIYVWVQNLQKYSTPWSHWYIIISSSKPYRNHILDDLKYWYCKHNTQCCTTCLL